ncbi:alpha/beta hydrolase [Microbacterium atlanticum]|uniref:alpha/beta hydrolase n=1 Tax=Microbacterium atlanticum TaxID=2782168 RepID=UPI001888050C|nr:alpha/beta fold hydrolase [Microbacterium atlanticum]
MTDSTTSIPAESSPAAPTEALLIQEQGSFAFGGTVVERPDGATVHTDHGYVQYQIPVNAKKLPIVMWHGYGQSARTWETTPDGREGFQTLFLRRGYPVYLIDQPRRGRASTSSEGIYVPGANDEEFFFTDQAFWDAFRIGEWDRGEQPRFHAGVQFPQDPESISQYLRSGAASVGPDGFDDATREVFSDAVAALFDRIGPAILLIHSTCGAFGWRAASKSENVKAVVGYEIGPYSYPISEPPAAVPFDIPELEPWVAADLIPDESFDRLARIPIQIVWGDFLQEHAYEWAPYVARSKQFVAALRERGGDAENLFLPEIGIHGNTHFPFSDLNSLEIADQLSAWLARKGLDG